jgi:hypothetical protein
MFFKTEQFLDNEGRTIYKQTSLGEDPQIYFYGSFPAETAQGVMPFSFQFPEDYSLEKCTEEFDTIAEEKINEHNEQNKIVTPEKMSNPDNVITMPS